MAGGGYPGEGNFLTGLPPDGFDPPIFASMYPASLIPPHPPLAKSPSSLPPVTLDPLAVAFCDEHMPGWKFVDPAQSGAFAGHVLQREISIERLQVDVSRDLREAQQRLQLRRKGERPVGKPRPDKRLLAEPVARQHEPLAGAVPERERKHSMQSFHELRPALLVEMRQHRGVTRAAHLVSAKLVPQLAEVVRLAVVDGDDVAGLVRHRLVTGLEVDHLQPLVAEHAMPERIRRAFVGPAMLERGAHGVHELRIRGARWRIESGDAAHGTHTARAVRGRLVPCGTPTGRRGLEAVRRATGEPAGWLHDRRAHAAPCGRGERGSLARTCA